MGNSLEKPGESLEVEDPTLESPEEDDNASFTCEICIEPFSTNDKFTHCKNPSAHNFCKECIAKYIQLKIELRKAKIQCPGLNCQQVLEPLACREIISESVFSKWCDNLCDDYVLGFERSHCPNRVCGEVVVNECGGAVKKSKCPNCREVFCFGCSAAWHPGLRCAENRSVREPNDILFLQLVERKAWINCPGCGHFVERIEGCNSIKCRFCFLQFLYFNV